MSALFEKLLSLMMALTFVGVGNTQTELYVVTRDSEEGGIRGEGLSNDNANIVKTLSDLSLASKGSARLLGRRSLG